MFSLICGIQAQYKYKQSYIYVELYTCIQKWDWEVRLREEEKKKTKIMSNNEIYHICVGKRHRETHWKPLNNPGYGKKG
jgi:hypothetical protein